MSRDLVMHVVLDERLADEYAALATPDERAALITKAAETAKYEFGCAQRDMLRQMRQWIVDPVAFQAKCDLASDLQRKGFNVTSLTDDDTLTRLAT